jgi:P27 family predicted phage terminase small subunit
MAGRKAKPIQIKVLEGNRSKLKKGILAKMAESEPEITPVALIPPKYLSKDKVAVEYYKKIALMLYKYGLVTEIDIDMLAVHARAFSRWQKAEAEIDTKASMLYSPGITGYVTHNPYINVSKMYYKQYLETGREFGLTPSSRGRMILDIDGKKEDPFEGFLNAKNKCS